MGADTCEISPDVGAVDVNGSITVSPTVTSTYTITASGAGGQTTAQVTITVIPLPAVVFVAEPETIKAGESATLSWTVTHADTVTIEPDIASAALSGSQEVSPAQTTTYTLTAIGAGGTTTVPVTVDVHALVRTRIRYEYDAVGRIRKMIQEQLP